jgi:hypothetical protein
VTRPTRLSELMLATMHRWAGPPLPHSRSLRRRASREISAGWMGSLPLHATWPAFMLQLLRCHYFTSSRPSQADYSPVYVSASVYPFVHTLPPWASQRLSRTSWQSNRAISSSACHRPSSLLNLPLKCLLPNDMKSPFAREHSLSSSSASFSCVHPTSLPLFIHMRFPLHVLLLIFSFVRVVVELGQHLRQCTHQGVSQRYR